MVVLASAFLLLAATSPQEPPAGALRPEGLRCELHVEPLGIDVPAPELSWRLAPAGERTRGLRQAACQIQVAADPQKLTQEQPDLWDSGRLGGDATNVVYRGKALQSHQQCFWRVRAADPDGAFGPWSSMATFTMGMLAPTDWQAQWIGHDAPLQTRDHGVDLAGAVWLWATDRGEAAQGERCLRGHWRVPGPGDTAKLIVSADDQFELWLNGTLVAKSDGQTDAWRRPVEVDVHAALREGDNVIAARVSNVGGAGGLIAKLTVTTGGKSQTFATGPDWRQTEKAPDGWQQPGFDDGAFAPVAVAGKYGSAPWGEFGTAPTFLPPVRVLSHRFATGDVKRALLYASALGLYEVEIDGHKAGDAFLAPGWTDYGTRIPYQCLDVTRQLARGDHTITVLLADGWYSGYVGYGHHRDHYGERTRARVQLVLDLADGSRRIVASDGQWQATTGALREADLLMGETCDNTFTPPQPVPVDVSTIQTPMERHQGEPVRIVAELRPVSVTSRGEDTYVADLGQNIAGFARLRVQGHRGQRVTLRFAERLNPDGSVYTTNLRGARATDTYVCGGDGVETWQPRFTFHGFQYIEVKGLGHAPADGDLVGVALSSDTPMLGDFECSDAIVNKLVSNIRWTQRMNFLDVPTDCPQRDERLGWTGDAQAYIRTATCLADVQSFFHKWLTDLADAQRADGQFPMVAPLKVAGGDGGPAWADAGVICPWNVYEVYGDLRVLARQYPSMARFVEFCRKRCGPDLAPPAQFHCFGDWLNLGDPTPNELIFTAYFAHSTSLVAKSASALGKTDDAAKYEALARAVAAYFRKAFVEADGQIRGHSQTGYVLALAFDLLDDAQRAAAAGHLVAHLEKRNWHLATGFVGTKDLMLVLHRIGRDDVAYRLLHNQDFPSWGFEIAHGATSIWERWDGWTPDHGFQDPGMNSFAHYAFGAVGQWLFEVPGGIDARSPGFGEVSIAPVPGGTLQWAKARMPTAHGAIGCHWRYDGDRIVLEVTLPPNTTGIVKVPTADKASVRIDGKAPEQAAGVSVLGGPGEAWYRVGSGKYEFAAKRR